MKYLNHMLNELPSNDYAIICKVESFEDFETFKKDVELESDLEKSVTFNGIGAYLKVYDYEDSWVHIDMLDNLDKESEDYIFFKNIYERINNEI